MTEKMVRVVLPEYDVRWVRLADEVDEADADTVVVEIPEVMLLTFEDARRAMIEAFRPIVKYAADHYCTACQGDTRARTRRRLDNGAFLANVGEPGTCRACEGSGRRLVRG